MCIEDIRLGRKAGSIQQSVPITNAASTVILEADKKRIAIVISPPASGYITISLNNPAVLDQGINLPSTAGPLILNIKDHGRMVTMQLCAIHSAATPTIGILTSHLEDE